MVYYETSQEWFEQSSLLLQAYPTTTIITTKYKILPPTAIKPRKRKADGTVIPSSSTTDPNTTTAAAQPSNTSTSTPTPAAVPSGPKATLTLKTYNPVSGSCLKYRTDKAAEVGRLIGSLGRLGRHMAALPQVASTTEETVVAESQEAGEGAKELPKADGKVDGGAVEAKGTLAVAGGAPPTGAGGSGPAKKKKKGKK